MVLISSMRVDFSSLRVRFLKYFYAWRVSLFLIGVLVSNRFAKYSITGLYVDFLTGEWDIPIYAAAVVINLKEALTSLFSIVGANYATHAAFGRYHAIGLSLFPFITGLGLFPLAASKKVPMGPSIALFCVSLFLTANGEGMQKHTLFDFGYDQFKYQMEDEKKAKLQAHIWWNAGRQLGTVVGLIASNYLPESIKINWWVFGGVLSCGLTAVTSIIYILGKLSFFKARLVRVKAPIIDVLKVLVAAVRKRHLPYATDPSLIYEEGRNPTTAGNAMQREEIQTTEGTEKNQVGRRGLAGDDNPAAHSKLSARKLFLVQGSSMRGNITLAILLAVQKGSQLLIGQVLLPLLKRVARLKDVIPPLVRIGIGLFISILCCIVSGIVERQRLNHVERQRSDHVAPDEVKVHLSIFWLVPQCFLLGAAVGSAEDGISDFFDTRVPQELRVCYSLTSESVKGVGCLLNSLILAAIHLFSRLANWIGDDLNTCKLHIVYFMIAGMSTVNLFFYCIISRKYVAGSSHDQLPFDSADHERPKEDQSELPTREDDKQDEPNPEEDDFEI